MDLNIAKRPCLRTVLDRAHSCQGARMHFIHKATEYFPFPNGTRGFYYFRDAGAKAPKIAGEIRFRVTPNESPASFPGGVDLLLPNAMPWRIPLLCISQNLAYKGIRQTLLQDKLVDKRTIDLCRRLQSQEPVHRSSRIIHSFGQLFSIRFDVGINSSVHLLTHKDCQLVRLHKLSAHNNFPYTSIVPYAGM